MDRPKFEVFRNSENPAHEKLQHIIARRDTDGHRMLGSTVGHFSSATVAKNVASLINQSDETIDLIIGP